ncbi:ninja-family protein AFP1 isoform X3 [Ziziphus jujuba]|uniref:Ninja-family protein n=1 Tax=Ziziphus jujuba TaxID=326968 RepID=A0ABM3IKE2_ZIZJJ|nr:ninja-family protein AFP1 isoform X3 [Ziziphus jujuba]
MGEDKVAALKTGLFSMQNDDEIENPTNFFQRFSSEKIQISVSEEFSQQPDLSLRLSLGGPYGENSKQNNNNNNKLLARSSSVGGVMANEERGGGGGHADTGAGAGAGKPKTLPAATTTYLSLSRSCSLPVESEKRMIELKEFQAIKRMVAKKRMVVEKQRNCSRVSFEDEKSQPEPEVTLAVPAPPISSSEMAAWAAASATKSPALSRAILKIKSQGHVFDGKQAEGYEDSTAGKKILSATQSLSEQRDKEPAFTTQPIANGKSVGTAENKQENPTKKAKVSNGIVLDNGMDVMTKMPSVSCIGDGPNGRRIEGFLYKYTKSQVKRELQNLQMNGETFSVHYPIFWLSFYVEYIMFCCKLLLIFALVKKRGRQKT